MADFKDEISPAAVRALADELVAAWPEFPAAGFVTDSCAGLEELELMARVRHVAGALGRHLPADFEDAAGVLDAALASPAFMSWITLPCGFFVAQCGIEQPHVALPLLARLSPRFSSEGPVRPFSGATRTSPCRICEVARHGLRSLVKVTVRKLYPSAQRIEVEVNGTVLGGVEVDLVEP